MLQSERLFLRTDIPADAISSLELLSRALSRSETELSWWKWATVAGHMAASTSLIGFLTATDGTGALRPSSTKALRSYYDSRRNDPKARYPKKLWLADFPELVDRAVGGARGFGDPLDIDADWAEHLRVLNDVRNGFTHFADHSWSIQVEYVRYPLLMSVKLVSLIQEHGWAFRHSTDTDTARRATLLIELENTLEALGNG